MPGSTPHHTDKWRRCVQQVQGKGTGNAYAICTANLGASIEADDARGRGYVAPPADHMPRSMSSRCMGCGKDMSVNDARFGGEQCSDCAQHMADCDCGERCALEETTVSTSPHHPPNPNHIQPPRGSSIAPGKSIGPISVAPSATAAPGA